MRALFSTLVAFFLSLLAGGMVAQQLALMTGAGEEYILVFIMVVLLAIVFAAVFLLGLLTAGPAGIAIAGKWSLVVFAVLFAALLGFEFWAVGGDMAKLTADLPIIGGLVLPGIVIIAVDWLFLRWRLGKATGAT